MASVPITDHRPYLTETERIERWRLEQVLRLGVTLPLAETFAAGSGDLGQLRDLVEKRGCPPDTAAEIVR